jgi:hypothetical protein
MRQFDSVFPESGISAQGCADESAALLADSSNVARLCRDRLFANRGRMPGFSTWKKEHA